MNRIDVILYPRRHVSRQSSSHLIKKKRSLLEAEFLTKKKEFVCLFFFFSDREIQSDWINQNKLTSTRERKDLLKTIGIIIRGNFISLNVHSTIIHYSNTTNAHEVDSTEGLCRHMTTTNVNSILVLKRYSKSLIVSINNQHDHQDSPENDT